MKTALTYDQEANRLGFREFVEREIRPHAAGFDRSEKIPSSVIQKLAGQRYLGAVLPDEFGGRAMDSVTLGLLNEEIGRGCSSVRSLLTVHHMVAIAILKFGTAEQKQFWLPQMATGQAISAFALSEPNVGSDAAHVETSAVLDADLYVVNGEKKWITAGQIADLFLVFAQCEGKPTALLVPRQSENLSIKAITGLLGVRGSMLASLRFEDCRVPKENVIGRLGLGFSHVAASALDYGRFSVAWGSVGIVQACLEASLQHANERKQFESLLKDHQLVRRMITGMMTDLRAARLLCLHAAHLRESAGPELTVETLIAKYFAARAAMKAARDAVQIHGALGCTEESPVSRYFRDAKIMEIIEGSNELLQQTIAQYGYFNL